MPFDQNQLPTWNKEGVEPPQSLKDEGWQPSQKPPADYFNWFFNKTFKALQSLFASAQHKEEKGQPNGYAALDENGKVINADGTYPGGGVTSVNNKTGAVTLSAADVGAETPAGAQEKADQAEQNAKDYTDQKLTNLSNNDTVQGMQKEIANLNLQLEASQRVPNGYTFGTDFLNTFGMTIDYTKTTAIGALTVGTTTIPVQSVTGFSVGQEVTIYDDVNLERVTISAIDTTNKTLTVSALTKSYKDKANVARTMAVADTVNKCLKFGGWSTQTTNTVTDATVVASAYDTSGNGGRKLVRLSDGSLIACVYNSAVGINAYKSTDNGNTWTSIGTVFSSTTVSGFSIVNVGNVIHLLVGSTTGVVSHRRITSSGVIIDTLTVDSSQTALGNVSLAINSAGTELHAAWSSKNSTYPNSFNIRYAKGTINADGSVTWGAVEQVTKYNNSSFPSFATNPSIILDSSGVPIIIMNQDGVTISGPNSYNSNSWAITALKRSQELGIQESVNSPWTYKHIYLVTNTSQYSPSACVDKNGRIWVAWHGTDSTDTTANNIRVAYSDDGGKTWSAMQKLTSGNTVGCINPSITVNMSNVVFILFSRGNSSETPNNIWQLSYNGSWSSATQITNLSTIGASVRCSALYDISLDFSQPLFIYNNQSKVGFYGTWTAGSTVPILENDIRFTVKNTDEVVTWAERDELAGFIIDAKLNGQAMTKTSVTGEDQFTGTLPSVQPAELRLTMTRANTADDVKISKILGGVA